MFNTSITCGYCHEYFANQSEYSDHPCEAASYFTETNLPAGKPIQHYNAEAEAFLAKYPEFINYQSSSYLTELNEEPESYDEFSLPLIDAQGPDVTDFSRGAEWDSIYSLRDNYQRLTELNAWRDLDPNTCTHAINWWRTKGSDHIPYAGRRHMPTKGNWSELTSYEQRDALDYNDPHLRNRFEFNDLQGFVAETLIDMEITAKFHAQVFNGYTGNDGKFHIGLLTFNYVGDRPSVVCKFKGCYYYNTPFTYDGDFSKGSMIDFTIACIRHGNNHAPNWLRRRHDFTYIHANNCDTKHPQSDHCNANNPVALKEFTTESPEAALDFLIQHRKFCRSTKCRCTHYYHLLNERLSYDYAA